MEECESYPTILQISPLVQKNKDIDFQQTDRKTVNIQEDPTRIYRKLP